MPYLAGRPDGGWGVADRRRSRRKPRGVLVARHPDLAGLSPLDLQVRLEDEDGLIGYADFGWGEVVGELDGKGKYGIGVRTDPEEAVRIVRREKQREDRIRALGIEVARWGYAEHFHPAVIGQRVRQAMARAAQRRRPA